MKSRTFLPIRWKLLIPTLAICATAGYFGHEYLKSAWSHDYEKLLVDFSLKRLKSVSDQMESRLQIRYRELEGVCQRGYRAHKLNEPTTGPSIFEAAGPELRKELLGVSFFRPEESGKVSYFHYVNWKLLSQDNLPRDVVDQINRKYPLDIRALLRKSEVQFFNRSVLNEHGEPIPVVTLAFFGKGMSPLESNTLILADLKSDFLSVQENAGELGEVFWMRRDGTLLAHPSASMAYRYAERPMGHEARPLMQKATEFGEHVQIERDGRLYLSSTVPTAIEDVFAVSEVPQSSLANVTKNALIGIGGAFAGLVASLSLFLIWFAGRVTSRIRNIEVALKEVAQGYIPSKRLRYRDEFGAIVSAMQELFHADTKAESKTGKPGFTQSEAEKEPVLEDLKFSEVLQVESTQIAFYQPSAAARNPAALWDVSRMGNRVWFLLGTAAGDAQQTAAVLQLTKKSMPVLRVGKGKDGAGISEQITQLNRILFDSFQGKAWLQMTAVELQLDTGKVFSINASNEAPLLIPNKLGPNPEGSNGEEWLEQIEPKEMMESLLAVGTRADTTFKAWETKLQAKDAFCLFQKDARTVEQGPISFRPEIRNLVLRTGCPSVKELRYNVLNSPARGKMQNTLMLAVVHFGAVAAPKAAQTEQAAPTAEAA